MHFISVEECKSAWKSMKDSNRYQIKKKVGKSGSSGGDILTETQETDEIQWDLEEDLSFLPNTSKKRR